jgi:hypothetical protein
LHETFPSLKCFDNEKLRVINPRTVTYIHALIINSISIVFEAEGAMVDVYSKMKPDSFTSQLQTVLTAYYEDIMGFQAQLQGASGCPKSKVVKRKFEDQEDAGLAPDAAVTPATPPPPPPTPPPPPPPRRTRAWQPPVLRSLPPSPALSRAGARAGGWEGQGLPEGVAAT